MLGNGFLPMFAVASGGGLVGATWALDGSARAYNTPTLGAELLTNGGLENWTTATNLASWTEIISSTSTINQESSSVQSGSYALRIDIGASDNNAYIQQNASFGVGQWGQVTCYARNALPGRSIVWRDASSTTLTRAVTTSYELYTNTARSTSSVASLLFGRHSGNANSSTYFDNISAKVITLPTTLATIAGTSATQTAAAKIHTLTTGTQAGVVSLLDSASNPQNFLIAYHDGTNVRLDKCVSGVYTNLITSAVAFTSLDQIEIRRPSGNTFQLWYNGVQSGVDQTVSDAGIISNTIYGLFSTFSGNLFSEFSLGGAVIPFGF